MPRKPLLHYSHINTATNCGIRYYRRYRLGEKVRPGIALPVGSSVHEAVAKNLRHKASRGRCLKIGTVEQAAFDSLNKHWDEDDIALTPAQKLAGEKKTKGAALDLVVALAGLHCREIAPLIKPISAKHVERSIVVKLPDWPFDLAMTLDCQEKRRIRDCKTSAQRWTQDMADASLQLTMYAFGVHINDDERFPLQVVVDNLVKTATPRKEVLISTRNSAHVKRMFNLLEIMAESFEKGIYLPPNWDWYGCSMSRCGYAKTCKYWSGRP